MEQYLNQIKAHPAFEGITQDEDILWLRKCMDAVVESFPKGETVFREGEERMFAGIVLEGTALTVSTDGTLEKIGPGGYLFDQMPAGRSFYAPYTVLADSDLTIFSMRVLRLAKLCSFRCVFHARLLENMQKYFA
ncbi:MAG: cyclic nucleotide-binding domain-containing protein [Bacillota bacterium]|jgi:CRP-like cAMP-binding protein|nr:cyclic nucleotide-binding domain-containing protein [Eubacteriales bacterium]MDD4286049.1 cyclic nucleotide-binding domain-containing protein [Eubacteriales bacterium]MDI9492335.1 cyclic nucleotide-binding domain-containing protein [Bacillota bacterium]NLV69862.1 Crp/Fnr family transcriptional regulator [Clostridiales bacterium]